LLDLIDAVGHWAFREVQLRVVGEQVEEILAAVEPVGLKNSSPDVLRPVVRRRGDTR
jgi:hypothetical protein